MKMILFLAKCHSTLGVIASKNFLYNCGNIHSGIHFNKKNGDTSTVMANSSSYDISYPLYVS